MNASTHEPYTDLHSTPDERTYATFTHLVGLLGMLDFMILGLIGTIVMWRVRAGKSVYLDDHGREAVNFQISLLLYMILGSIVLGIFTAITLGAGIVLALPVGALGVFGMFVLRLVGGIRGSMAANRGEYYRYPMCIRFLQGPADANVPYDRTPVH